MKDSLRAVTLAVVATSVLAGAKASPKAHAQSESARVERSTPRLTAWIQTAWLPMSW